MSEVWKNYNARVLIRAASIQISICESCKCRCFVFAFALALALLNENTNGGAKCQPRQYRAFSPIN